MTAKEKAKELFDSFHYQICQDNGISENPSTELCAKQCALIAVDEILENGNLMPQLQRHRGNVAPIVIHLEYWQEVKQEIEKL